MLPPPNTIGPGVLSPVEIDAESLFREITQRTANLIFHGPSLDDLEWYASLTGDSDDGDAAK